MREINASDFETEVLNGGNVLVDFYSTECAPCEAIAPKLEGLEMLCGKEVKDYGGSCMGREDFKEMH